MHLVAWTPPAWAAPTNPLCKSNESYRESHPLICDTGSGPGTFPGSGGGSGGGLFGVIRSVLGGLGIL